MKTTPQEHAILLLHSIGLGLVVLGGIVALLNWWIFGFQVGAKRRGEEHIPSMIGGISFLLFMVGCLLDPSLRIHALWIWALDPSTDCVVFHSLLSRLRPEK